MGRTSRTIAALQKPAEAAGIPTVLPYGLGCTLLSALWSVPVVQAALVRQLRSKRQRHPLWAEELAFDGDSLRRRFHASFFRRWRMNALARCSEAALERWVSVSGQPHLAKARAAGRGLLLIGAHLGADYSLPVALQRLGLAPACLWNPERLERGLVPRELELIRISRPGAPLLQALVAARQRLRAGGTVLTMGDGVSGAKPRTIEFLGVEQRFPEGFASLALASGAPALPVFCVPDARGRLHVEFQPALDPGEGGRSQRIERLLREYLRRLERRCLEDPLLMNLELLRRARRPRAREALRAAAERQLLAGAGAPGPGLSGDPRNAPPRC